MEKGLPSWASPDSMKRIGSCLAVKLLRGVPQGTTLGHIVTSVFNWHFSPNLTYFLYADDLRRSIKMEVFLRNLEMTFGRHVSCLVHYDAVHQSTKT